MKKETCLTYRDLNKMDQLLKKPTSIVSNSELTELDQLAIKIVVDIEQYPTRFFYGLRRFNNENGNKHSENSEIPYNPSLQP